MLCLTFTFPRDFRRAAFHASLLPKWWRRVWCVESAHADAARAAAPAGTEILVRDFPRGGTLRSDAALLGMRDVYLELAERPECDLLVKLDSDTAIFRPDAWTAPFYSADADFTYIRRHHAESRLLANGCCYAVSRRALRRLVNFSIETDAPAAFEGHEDYVFSAFWTARRDNRDLTLCQIDKRKIWWAARRYEGADCFAAHCGYVSEDEDFALCAARRNAELRRIYEN